MCQAVGHKGHMPLVNRIRNTMFLPLMKKSSRVKYRWQSSKLYSASPFVCFAPAILPLMKIFLPSHPLKMHLPLMEKNPGHASVYNHSFQEVHKKNGRYLVGAYLHSITILLLLILNIILFYDL